MPSTTMTTTAATTTTQPSLWTPLRGTPVDIPEDARWEQYGIVVAGGYGEGNGTNQFKSPEGLFLDDEENLYFADEMNHRIMKWKVNATTGQVVAGGNGRGNETHQLDYPTDVIVDKETDSLIICDCGNKRVVRWPRQNRTSGPTIILHVDCWGLTMDESGSFYVTLPNEHVVRRYERGDSVGTVVAGGNGRGSNLNQLNRPSFIFVDQDHSVYVTDHYNDRVMKWKKNAETGIVVAGGHGEGSSLEKFQNPRGVVVDKSGTVYVADDSNHRIMRWTEGARQGSAVIDGKAGQWKGADGLTFDRYGNLYVVNLDSYRVRRFDLIK
ncbi:unnamed protein product [Rotaria sp. Silwood1]|nr:unnamed protein product [Rotaria sp. Silwood1]CAF3743688.1 unnamed protein product [Rotaria sp. Silwood1]CAF3902963.1 unnamed protein product [Rotaria sp. Silwood1]CAF4914663.1 unnamed protein product [Rotaria sp. Silwood1]CAF4960491.1 unnamed protein product [Rotaria sp. Silwood1]